MLGHIMEWFNSALAGIGQTDDSIGFSTIEINPMPCGDLSWAEGTLQSPYGEIVSSWKLSDDCYTLEVTIPENTNAII